MKKLKQMYRCMEDRKYGNGKTTGCPTVLLRVPLGHERQAGFTLVELVIVIAIVIILSVISVPIYRGYIDKSKMAEGYALAGAIISAQKAYYSEFGNFLRRSNSSSGGGYTSNETVLGIDARGNKYFTWFQVGVDDVIYQKYYFGSRIYKPTDIGLGKEELFLQYNTTKGTKISEIWDIDWAN